MQCEGNTVNPNYDAQCVACGAKTVANAGKITCGKRSGFPISERCPTYLNTVEKEHAIQTDMFIYIRFHSISK